MLKKFFWLENVFIFTRFYRNKIDWNRVVQGVLRCIFINISKTEDFCIYFWFPVFAKVKEEIHITRVN